MNVPKSAINPVPAGDCLPDPVGGPARYVLRYVGHVNSRGDFGHVSVLTDHWEPGPHGSGVELRGVAVLKPRLDLANHSPDGLAWGYFGSGPSQLALALCAHLLGNDALALAVYRCRELAALLAGLPIGQPWELGADQLRQLLEPTLRDYTRDPAQDPVVRWVDVVRADPNGTLGLRAERHPAPIAKAVLAAQGVAWVGNSPGGGRTRPMLWDQPKYRGFAGPMYGGPGVLRYESTEAYEACSQ